MDKNEKQQHVTARKLFPRKQRAPLAVQDKAALWLDLYVDFATALTTSRDAMPVALVVQEASELADRSLDVFESRWPTAEVPGRD